MTIGAAANDAENRGTTPNRRAVAATPWAPIAGGYTPRIARNDAAHMWRWRRQHRDRRRPNLVHWLLRARRYRVRDRVIVGYSLHWLTQQCLIKTQRRELSILADRDFCLPHPLGPFDIRNPVTVDRRFRRQIFFEIVVGAGRERDQVAIG